MSEAQIYQQNLAYIREEFLIDFRHVSPTLTEEFITQVGVNMSQSMTTNQATEQAMETLGIRAPRLVEVY